MFSRLSETPSSISESPRSCPFIDLPICLFPLSLRSISSKNLIWLSQNFCSLPPVRGTVRRNRWNSTKDFLHALHPHILSYMLFLALKLCGAWEHACYSLVPVSASISIPGKHKQRRMRKKGEGRQDFREIRRLHLMMPRHTTKASHLAIAKLSLITYHQPPSMHDLPHSPSLYSLMMPAAISTTIYIRSPAFSSGSSS